MSVRSDLQAALDGVLMADKVYSHWGRKQAIPGENPGEYVVYTIDGYFPLNRVDGEVFQKTANPVVRYYHAFGMPEEDVYAREQQIYDALNASGFYVNSGPFDAGDIDDAGMNTTIFECTHSRIADG